MKVLIAILLITVLTDEKKCDHQHSDVPPCIQQMIADYSNRPIQNPPAEFYSYDYKGQTVYYMKPPCCDQMSKLYDSNCNFICSPDGGITGKGDGKCTDFYSTRQNEKLIWKDDRK